MTETGVRAGRQRWVAPTGLMMVSRNPMENEMNRIFCSMVALVALAGCTTSPDMIQPAAYASDCSADRTVDIEKLNRLTMAQRKSREADIVGVMLIGLPVSKMTGGDKSGEIARLKACVNK